MIDMVIMKMGAADELCRPFQADILLSADQAAPVAPVAVCQPSHWFSIS